MKKKKKLTKINKMGLKKNIWKKKLCSKTNEDEVNF